MKENNFLLVVTSENLYEDYNGKELIYYLKDFSKVCTIVAVNNLISDDNVNKYCDYFIAIDYNAYFYLKKYPQYFDKIYIDNTIKKYANRIKIPSEIDGIKNVFAVSNSIHREYTGRLYLYNKYPTVAHTALNFCLLKGIENGFTKKDINIYCLGLKLNKEWTHYKKVVDDWGAEIVYNRKTDKDIEGKREGVYQFKQLCNLYTINKDHDLDLDYYDPFSLINKNKS